MENIAIINVMSMLAMGAGETPESVSLFTKHLGPHTLLLDDFTLSTDPLPAEAAPADPKESKGIWIDAMNRETLAWMPLGVAQMRLDKTEVPFKGRALRMDYTQGDGPFIAVIHDMRRYNLTKADRLSFEVASAKSAKVLIGLEEKGGARYNALIDVPGDSVPTRKSISFADFALAEDSPKDSNGHLDLDQLKSITIVDATGFFGLGKQKNTLWIGPIRALTVNL